MNPAQKTGTDVPMNDQTTNQYESIPPFTADTPLPQIGELIQHNESHYKQLLQHLPVAVYTCDMAGKITFFNLAATLLWGRTPELGKDMWCGSARIYRPNGTRLPLDDCPMARTLKEGRPIPGEEIIIERPDGMRVFVNPFPQPVFDSTGTMTGAVNLLIDITTRKQNEEKLANHAAIVSSSDDAIISKTLEGIITSWNIGAQRIFGYTAQEMIGQPINKLIPADRQNEEPAIIERLKRGERVDHFETKRITKDHRLLDISLTISPIKDKYGNILGASKIARDITAQRNAERSLRDEEERLRMAVESTKLGTWEYDAYNHTLGCSEESRKIWGIPAGIPMDKSLLIKLLYPADLDRVLQKIRQLTNPVNAGKFDIQCRIHRYDDNDIRWIAIQGKVHFDAHHIAEKYLGTILDITDEKMAKERLENMVLLRTKELTAMNEQLKKSNHALEQFAYIASHDLQEPLRKIQVFSELIQNKLPLEDSLQHYFNKVTSSAQRMSRLIRDVLEYSRLSAVETPFVSTDLNLIVKDVLAEFEVMIDQKKAVIRYDTLPVIKGNPLQLNQLFRNLIGNSLKFCISDPEITISTGLYPATQIPGYVPINKKDEYFTGIIFKDNGIGFSPQYAEQIFSIFQRLNTHQAFSGTGIGLALCKKIVENHHGIISAKSELGAGATFSIFIPTTPYNA
ncbi:PAS domain S-box protein [Chitinophaga defluvii]|uniref:histidine kinase n=1 Tax=Chitinophaga defluvii TaxID=3163343 RepID=A0ABV2SYS3_9BACT